MATRDTQPLTPAEPAEPNALASGERRIPFWEGAIGFVLEQRFVIVVLVLLGSGWGLAVAPFQWDVFSDAEKLPVDAIPNVGENQQIVFVEWTGRAPDDVEDQVTYPLTTQLLGVAGVKTVRSVSMFGFTSIYVIFEEGVDFYWSRARIVEKLASLPANLLPEGVKPQLGPDSTALGQIFSYTLEGRDRDGKPAGGWDLHELRTIQDYQVRYALSGVSGVSEAASIGGHVLEYQVEVDPAALRNWDLSIMDVYRAVQESNVEKGARETEINGVEYLIRGVGFIENLDDINQAVVDYRDGTAVRVSDVARVTTGPAPRRGALDVGGAEAVGGVVAARDGANPMEVIDNVKAAIDELAPSLPERTLDDGRVSKVTVVPFYDRSTLITETVGTLEQALVQQVLITVLVVLVLLFHLRAAVLVSGILPFAILMTFLMMKATGMTANVVALSGIAIAIGTMVDMGIVISESIIAGLERDGGLRSKIAVIRESAGEVAGAVLTAAATTIISFLPVLLLEGQEGRLFRPLALTKTYALSFSAILAVLWIPVLAYYLMGKDLPRGLFRTIGALIIGVIGIALAATGTVWLGLFVVAWAVAELVAERLAPAAQSRTRQIMRFIALGTVTLYLSVALARDWMPIGAGVGVIPNLVFVVLIAVVVLGSFWLFLRIYPRLLRWVLRWKLVFFLLPVSVALLGAVSWMGSEKLTTWLPENVREGSLLASVNGTFPGIGREFMPQLNEGSFLYMPTSMPHASIGETLEMVSQLDMLIKSVPEVTSAVGKLGRAETPLDPAPVSMVETIITYASEYRIHENGHRILYRVDESGEFVRDQRGELIEAEKGKPYRNWRPEIQSREDIWDAIVEKASVPGLTSAPMLQPISTRIVMLQSGIRAPMAIRLQGVDLEILAELSVRVEGWLRDHPMVRAGAVNADRPVGKPYIEAVPDREKLAQYGVTMADFQSTFATAVGGAIASTSIEGRERYAMRVRYPRELRDDPEAMQKVLIETGNGALVPLSELATIEYKRGPQAIKSEDARLVTYVMFDKLPEFAEVGVVESVRAELEQAIATGELDWPEGVTFSFAGSYENALRAKARLQWLVPIVLVIIVLLLYTQFRSLLTVTMIFSSVIVTLSAGFILLWLYGQPWFLDVHIFGVDIRDVFQIEPRAISVAVWVGFIALFGIATDDGVVMATRLDQTFAGQALETREDVHEAIVEAGCLRSRACVMTTATTILALLPVLTSYGAGSNVMIPMAIPILGGMTVEILTLFIVPALYSIHKERQIRRQQSNNGE